MVYGRHNFHRGEVNSFISRVKKLKLKNTNFPNHQIARDSPSIKILSLCSFSYVTMVLKVGVLGLKQDHPGAHESGLGV